MPFEITMPQLSDTMSEGTIVKWHKKEGEQVSSGDEVADVETDKATMPMEAYESGTLAYIAVKEGERVAVGQLIGVIATTGEDPATVKREAEQGKVPAQTSTMTPPPVAQTHGASPPDIETNHVERERERSTARQQQVAGGTDRAVAAAVAEAPTSQRIRISPLARRIAQEKGIDPHQLTGSGPGGRIVKQDILSFVESGGAARQAVAAPNAPSAPAAESTPTRAPAPVPFIASGEKKVISMTKMRSAIAAALLRSKQTIPHFYETVDIDLEAVWALRQRLNERLETQNVRLSVADFIAKATAAALLRHPTLNARFNAEKGEITQYGDVNLGIAVSIPDGLIVPVLRCVNRMSLREIRERSADLIDRARAQRLRREEQTEGTFTISSLGTRGIREFSAIINPPEVAILAVGAAERRAVVRDGQVVPRMMLTVTLSADHRVVDGDAAANFLGTLKELLEEPAMMLV